MEPKGHKSSLPATILGHLNAKHHFPMYIFIVPFMPSSSKPPPSFRFPHQNPLYIARLRQRNLMLHPSYLPWFDRPRCVWWEGFVFVPSSLLILLHLSCLFVSLSLSRNYLYARCFTSAQLPCYLLWTDGQSNGKSKLKVCFCEVRFVKRKPSIQELKVTFFPLPHLPSALLRSSHSSRTEQANAAVYSTLPLLSSGFDAVLYLGGWTMGLFRPRQTRQLPRAVDLKGRLLSCQSY